MIIEKTNFQGVILIKPNIFSDPRGFFVESFRKDRLRDEGIEIDFIQENHSRSTKGVLRGMHFQKPPFAQTKLIRVARGHVLDVILDMRKSSSTYGAMFNIELSDENHFQLLVPKGFAHGFRVLSESADFLYKVDNLYNPEYEAGISWRDPHVVDGWIDLQEKPIVSDKDASLPLWDPERIIFE